MIPAASPSHPARPAPPPRREVAILVLLGAAVGWLWVIGTVFALMATTDMGQLGPGMAIFNRFNGLSELPEAVRAGLTALCVPGAAGAWTLGDLAAAFAMWEAMVLAMMLPSAAPMLAALSGDLADRPGAGRLAAAGLPLLGYLTVWTGFSVLATALQWGLAAARLSAPAMGPMTAVLAGSTLLAAGLYQVTPQKQACLARCRSPQPAFPPAAPDAVTVWRLGVTEGLACLGCCWALMAAMFAAGTMNVVWIVLLGSAMVLEKTGTGPWPSRLIGLVLAAVGTALLVTSPASLRLLGLV